MYFILHILFYYTLVFILLLSCLAFSLISFYFPALYCIYCSVLYADCACLSGE